MAQRVIDASGAVLSGLCLAHCLVLPLAGSLLPLASVFASDEVVHVAVLGLAAPMAWLAFGLPLLRKRIGWPLPSLAATGIGLLTAALSAGSGEAVLTMTGSASLAVAHLLNLRDPRH